jgi:DNA-binding NarL/FixJ family response regulator
MAIRALIVDDHAPFRWTARQLLEGEGFAVVGEASDGAEAVAAAAALHPDLVLLDVYLPDADGFEIAEHLTSAAAAPIVVLTSSRDGSDYGPLVSRCGARGFVPKAELSAEALNALLD